jgi:glycosyltransferase involved in cell wall biosynthesis
LLHKEAESQVEFLHSLDLFVYDLGPRFSESWGRAVVEAMLTGCVPLVSGEPRHHLGELVPHGVGGFLCTTPEDWRESAQRLRKDELLRRKMSRAAREFSENELCGVRSHFQNWQKALAE